MKRNRMVLATGIMALLALLVFTNHGNQANAQVIQLRFAHITEETHPTHIGAKQFAARVEERTKGQVILGPGALYGSIQKMLLWGLIEESEDRPESHLDDQRRRYYRITPAGQQALQAELQRMQGILTAAKNELSRLALQEAR